MDPDRFARLQELFHAALALSPGERRAYLEAASGGDRALVDEALLLLASAEEGADRLEEDVRVAAAALARDAGSGRRIGPYRVLRELGEGGMGVVYLAVRDDDAYRKRVAIKVASAAGGRQEARFVQERQILAALEHPGIARLLDGGSTESGRPYLVMEYVEGEPIDLYCDRCELTIAARLKLFRLVCQAVQHAHQGLVVHRDIKPGNILVTASGEPKLLDFGIAKLLSPDPLADGPPLTGTGLRPMTPDYASPEQVRGAPVTTAADVYSLGVVLYELLAGRRPFRLTDKPLHDIARLIADAEPGKPSAVVTKPVEAAGGQDAARRKSTPEEIARARGTDPKGLRRRLRGDLDNIVLKAMSKAPSRRYESALQLSEDLRRHLEDEPVLARPPTWTYLAGKFARRNRLGLAVAVAFTVLVVGFAANRARLAAELAQERDLAQRETAAARRASVFLQDLFRASDPAKADSITARELLDRAVEHTRVELEDEPGAQATLFETLGSVYGNLGLYEKSAPLLEDALRIRSLTFGASSLEAAASLESLGNLQRERALYPEAETSLRRSLRIREKLLRPEDPALAASLHGLGVVERYAGHYTEAEGLYRRALAIRERRPGEEPGVAETLERLAQVLQDEWRSDEAEALARRAVEVSRGLGSTADAQLARALDRLGLLLRDRGQLEQAEAATREALKLRRGLFGPAHPNVAVSLSQLASVLREKGDLVSAESLDRQALDLLGSSLGHDHPDVAAVEVNLADLLDRKGELEAADRLARHALDVRVARFGPDNPLTLRASEGWSRIRARQGFRVEAETAIRDVLARRRRVLPPGHPDVGESLLDLGMLLERRGDPTGAEPLLREAAGIFEAKLPRDHWQTAQTKSALGGCLAALGQGAEAERLLTEAEAVLQGRRGRQIEAREASERLARLYEQTGRAEKASALRARAAHWAEP
jgi:serine/threonine protein kinase/tetratricopeptide (TPR) repeat protein